MRQCERCTFETIDGTQIFYRHWPSLGGAGDRAILLLHRGHEHSGREKFGDQSGKHLIDRQRVEGENQLLDEIAMFQTHRRRLALPDSFPSSIQRGQLLHAAHEHRRFQALTPGPVCAGGVSFMPRSLRPRRASVSADIA